MFGVGGEHDLTELNLEHLSGWRNSRPVRVGNGAWSQRQIDVYGELLGAAHRLFAQLNPEHPGADAWREFLVGCADTAARRWRETDQGIWEVRGEPRHFLYSKLMCWVALDRAIELAEPWGQPTRSRAGGPKRPRSARRSSRRAGARQPAHLRSRSVRPISTPATS
jgi:GH15 family glucan-1,4-alpha-glucosidase